MRIALVIALALLISVPAQAGVAASQPAPDYALLLKAAAGGAGAAAALLGEEAALSTLLGPAGCLVWQQPGVAIVPDKLWEPGQPPKLWDPNQPPGGIYLDQAVLREFLAYLPAYSLEEPVVYPREEDYDEASPPPPQVYLLGRDAARRRLAQYYRDYQTWLECNTVDGVWPEGFRHVDEASLAVDCAAVYVADGQALSFFFTLDEDGRPRLTHLVIHPFFSA